LRESRLSRERKSLCDAAFSHISHLREMVVGGN
jgi:hypothetical protein